MEIKYEEIGKISFNGKVYIDTSIIAIPMILFCPNCSERHIDTGEFEHKLHHTHACQICGVIWRPAIEYTKGVQFLPGFKNVS